MALTPLVLPRARHFYQSVRLILKSWRKARKPLADWSVSALQFSSSLSLTATHTDVEPLRIADEQALASWELVVNDFGLLGIHGTLPHSYTEWIAEQLYSHNDKAIKAFLDIFNHRLNVLRFELWKKTHLVVAKELDDDFILPAIFNAIAGGEGISKRASGFIQPDNATLWARRTLANLTRLLQREFFCAVKITPFHGKWIDVESVAMGRLSSDSAALGQGMILGQKYWDIHASFHIRLGPVIYHQLTIINKKLNLIVKQYLHQSVTFTTEFILSTAEHCNKMNGQLQLGVNSCLGENIALSDVSLKYCH